LDNPGIIRHSENYVTTITMNSPETGNLINEESMSLFSTYLNEAVESEECRVIIIRGKDGVFSNGLDFPELIENFRDEIKKEFTAPYKNVLKTIHASPKPVISAIDGSASAGGMGFVLASDVALATKVSTFALSEVLFGLIPAIVFPFLLERVPFKKARYLVLTSEKFDAEEACRIGIIDHVADTSENMEKKIVRYIKRFLYSSPSALSLTKQYSDKLVESRLDTSLQYAQDTLTQLLNDKQNKEAIKTFLEGGLPDWAVRYKKRGKR